MTFSFPYSTFQTRHNSNDKILYGEYENLEVLGEGTYGKVMKVRDITTGQLYALKKIKPEQESDGITSTSLREISSLLKLSHPNIVQFV